MSFLPDDFLRADLPVVGKPVHRLGLAANYGIDDHGIRAALERGLNYVFWTPTAFRLTRVLRSLTAAQRDNLVLTTGPTLGFFPGSLRRRCERVLKLLQLDTLDVLQLYWLGKTSALSDGNIAELVKLKEEKKIRAIGISIHDRERAGRLVADSPIDLFMIRYNAAHPGAERDIFPHLEKRRPAIVAYTATSWRKLMKPLRGVDGPVPTAGDCYRFCLSSPHVDVVLTGPASEKQLDENLAAVAKGPLSDDEMKWIRAYGAKAHG